jgi:hypothetical protein
LTARKVLPIAAMLLWTLPAQSQQPAESQSCSGKMTEQLRRFNEQCLTDLVSYVASQPKASARVLGEKLKFYVQLTRTGAGLDAEAVSRANFPFMEAKTADALKQLGWSPPENEEGNFRKRFAADAPPARTAEDLAKALSAYGLTSGEAMSLTVGTQD